MEELEKTLCNRGGNLTGGELFAIFLASTKLLAVGPPSTESFYIQALQKSAVKGFIPAQAVIGRVFAIYDLPLTNETNADEIKRWLFASASTGSLTALQDLQEMDSDMAGLATSRFYLQGGYHQQGSEAIPERRLWANMTLTELHAMHPEAKDLTLWIHPLAIWNNHEAIRELLTVNNVLVNVLDSHGHSPLYLACKAGAVETVKVLCSQGADASYQDECA